MLSNKFFSEKKISIVYKLLHDLLFILIVFFVLTLIAEGLLPGIISSRLGLYKIIFPILIVIFFIEMASKKTGVLPSLFPMKKIGYVLAFILTGLIFNGMLGIGLSINIFILILALTVLYLSFRLFFSASR